MDFARKLYLHTEPQPLEASALDESLIFKVTHKTEPLEVIVGDHHEFIHHLFHSNQQPLSLGFPLLKEHNPHIDWSTGKDLNWAEDCTKRLKSCHDLNMKPVFNTVVHSDTDPELPDLKSVPGCYHDLGEVFSKSMATSLPPHRP